MSHSVVVVGAGNAGIPTAIEAADRGAHVILVEKEDFLGGMLHWSSATMSAAGTRLQKERGISDDTTQLHFDDCVRIGRNRNDPALLKLATENATETINWLESIGVPYTDDSPRLGAEHEFYTLARSYYPAQPGTMVSRGFHGGGIIFAKLEKLLNDRIDAGKIEVHIKTKMTGLITEAGRVVGITAEGPAGPVEFRGDAVILTTGGYSANFELMEQLHPNTGRHVTLCGPHATGDAIPLVEGLGGSLTNLDLLIPLLGFLEDPENPGFCRPGMNLKASRPPETAGDIWVNKNGERFIREDEKSPDARERAMMAQPDWVMWTIFDHPMREGFTQLTNERTRSMAHLGMIISADTIEELAEKIGLPPANLRKTVDAYNQSVESGSDPLGRGEMPKAIDEAPFHAVKSEAAIILSQAGIKVNDHLQPVRGDGSPIEGLYLAGEAIGAGQVMGDAFCSGMSAGAAVTTGRLAARFALGVEAASVA